MKAEIGHCEAKKENRAMTTVHTELHPAKAGTLVLLIGGIILIAVVLGLVAVVFSPQAI